MSEDEHDSVAQAQDYVLSSMRDSYGEGGSWLRALLAESQEEEGRADCDGHEQEIEGPSDGLEEVLSASS